MERNKMAARLNIIQNNLSNEIEEFTKIIIDKLENDEMDLMGLENNLGKFLNKVGSSLLSFIFEINGTGYTHRLLDCECGNSLEFVGNRKKHLTTLTGETEIKRAYYHCKECGTSYIPLDIKFDIEETGFSPGVRYSVNLLSSEMPFNRASDFLDKIVKIHVSKDKCKTIAENTGLEIESMNKEENNKPSDKEFVETDYEQVEQLYVSADGTMVNTTEGWKECKIGAIFTAHKDNDGNPVKDKVKYLGGFESSKHFGKRLFLNTQKLGVSNAKEFIVIGDGAKWIWNEADMHFPGAVQIVDWFHAAERIWDVSKTIYEYKEKTMKNYAEKLILYLKNGNIEKIIKSLKRIKQKTKKISEKVKETITYFKNNKQRMRYNLFREKGYFIGSGIVESACKHVVADRLKKSGMIWLILYANAILQLRICILNKRFEKFYKWKSKKLKLKYL